MCWHVEDFNFSIHLTRLKEITAALEFKFKIITTQNPPKSDLDFEKSSPF